MPKYPLYHPSYGKKRRFFGEIHVFPRFALFFCVCFFGCFFFVFFAVFWCVAHITTFHGTPIPHSSIFLCFHNLRAARVLRNALRFLQVHQVPR